jgi:hypothetical protein
VVQFDLDDILLGMREVDRQVVEVLGELACTISVRIMSSLHISPICCVPRGPSTVTSLDLMVTLTIREKHVSNYSSNAPSRVASRCKFCLARLAVIPVLEKTNRTHLPRERSRSQMNECTSFWTFRVVGMAGERGKNRGQW